ncbi:hypothetical protein CPB83DRAFT_9601 [Crepidotus variabilis]|uniref:NUC153 domain-containing protein n=1 Tax=Crepidotus variabilis TaxID=179855 RepID=A0A9P6EU75_9AGAR|nr:hypothetical protein CPB83DRAFT_9601 [Crepidotus variabilis]
MSDPRFEKLKSDPRFRRPKTKQNKVVIDERFKNVFKQPKKTGRKVDKYGRHVSDSQDQENLKRYYRLENDSEAEHDEDAGESSARKPDLARGEVILESSDEEGEDPKTKDSESDSDDGGFVTLGRGDAVPDNLEIDLNEDNFADLDAQAESYLKAQQDDDIEQAQPTTTERTRRLAVVNLDWDHVRAHHLYKICSSLVSLSAPAFLASSSSKEGFDRKKGTSKGSRGGPATVARGRVRSVKVYPSDFGKERMAREEREGPPPEIFKKKELLIDEINEKTVFEVGNEQQYDEDALRKYQLERLRYYYAIIECDTVDAASHIYNELEGTELERSANVFDMSFVPDDMSFDNEPRDEISNDLSADYIPVEFVTDALRHSKVKLTWDEDDPERHQMTRRTLTKKEIEENDFQAYIANTSSESEEEDIVISAASREDRKERKKKEKKASRDKLRALLLGGNQDDLPEGWGDTGGDHDVDMEITFTPGLSTKKSEEDETTLEKYQRKMREKRKKRKDDGKGKEKEADEIKHASVEDDFFEASEGEQSSEDEDEDKTDQREFKRGKKSKPVSESVVDETRQATAEELALLVAPDNPTDEPKHFNIKSVIKAEKKKKHKGRKGKSKVEEDNEAQEDFVVNVKDERFKALFEDHQFAIDPTNPHFKKTKAMSAFMDERQKRRREQTAEEGVETSRKSKDAADHKTRSLKNLVESVKRKSANIDPPGQGKRRKLQ